jgi:triacylglycerol esterase/lipase EstA (alpha/beta hydrolase family)
MPIVLAYHPMIAVGSRMITGKLDDYYTDDEILEAFSVKTFNELIQKLPLDTPIGSLYVDDKSEGSQDYD